MGVSPYNKWFSEQTLHDANKLSDGVETIRKHKTELLYEKGEALWFRSTDYGDDRDRVLQRSNGQYTYFAADVAYHNDKFLREMKHPTNFVTILGADHHRYVPRLKAAVNAL